MISKQITEYIMKNREHPENIEKLSKVIEDFFLDMSEEDSDIKEAFMEDIEEFTSGINMEVLTDIVKKFKHRDGSASGVKWSYDETESVAKQYDVANKITTCGHEYNPLHFWFTMNYVYAAHYNPSRTTLGYVELALDEYCNKNVCFKKYMRYIVATFK